MSSWVLDASAVLAVIGHEEGAARVLAAIEQGAVVSAVNFAEIVSRLSDTGSDELSIRRALNAIDIEVIEFDSWMAFDAGMLRPVTKRAGLSLGDRACLVLGQELGIPVLTADRAWANLRLPISIELIR